MSQSRFPVYSIDDLRAQTPGKNILTIERFGKYLLSNPHLHGPHTHTFYHLVYFTKGKGRQVIDFTNVPVQPGIIYFMNPSQVHQWFFDGEVDGYIANFSETFYEQLLISSQVVHHFDFFNGYIEDQVVRLSKPAQKKLEVMFEEMLAELRQNKKEATLMIATQLLQLFIMVQRDMGTKVSSTGKQNRHVSVFRHFTALVDMQYKDRRLPKEYAAQLFVTTNQLNAISKEVGGISSGEIIRNRVVLEAKRLLVNVALSIEEIAAELNFEDSSYFVKFFKKYTSQTPEVFRSRNYQG
jgi:AraC family transcriptional activator of pobA